MRKLSRVRIGGSLSVFALMAVLSVACVPTTPPATTTTTTTTTTTVPVLCTPGTYSATGAEPCTPAAAGTFVDTAGATSATPCPAGKYQPDTGSTACLLAPLGFYVPDAGAVAATPAPAGSFVDIAGAASATPCAVGTYQANVASISCQLAPIGTYVSTTGAVSATPCPAGTTTDFAGAASASDCVERLLAVAYSNVDGIEGYDPAADVLIAKVVDFNLDGLVSVGDEVVTDRYPLDFEMAAFGNFQKTKHTIAFVQQSQSSSIIVADDAGNRFYWEDNVNRSALSPPYGERYIEWIGWPYTDFLVVLGEEQDTGRDLIETQAGAASDPDSLLYGTQQSPDNDPFVDVELFN